MKVILLKGVPKLGKPEDVVEVSDGYAHNALFPRKLAVPATAAALATLKETKAGREAHQQAQHELLAAAIRSLGDAALVYAVPANEQGSLFSKIDAAVISDFLFKERRVSIDAACIKVPGAVIKKTGEYPITIEDGSFRSTVLLTVQGKK